MADPATIAIAVKTAVAVATDKRTWQTVAVIIGIAVGIMLLPLLLITSLMSGGAEQNKGYANIVFDGSPIPSDVSPENREYILQMQEAFGKLGVEIDTIKEKMPEEGKSSLDEIRIKAVFYSLYFGTDFSGLEVQYYKDFIACFINPGSSPPTAITDLNTAYTNVSLLAGREITETDKQNINGLYLLIKYGFAANPNFSGIPGEAFNDENFAKLMGEATKYIGYPYVWGGSSPTTSFDCSGFICWSYTQSGVRNLPRTTAQGIFNQCTPVSKDELKPGDLVFFQGTYDSDGIVSHIGIYVGDNQMLHCGDPIGYANLSNSYWKKHFYAWGRLN